MDFCPKWSPICANILPVMQCNTLTSSCTPFPLNMVKIRTVKTVSEKMQSSGYPNMSKSRLSSLLFKWKIRLLLAIFWHFWTNKTGCGQRLKGQNQAYHGTINCGLLQLQKVWSHNFTSLAAFLGTTPTFLKSIC